MIVLDVFAKVMKVTNNNGQQEARLAWYSPIYSHPIFLYSCESSFRLTKLYLNIEFRKTWVKFLQPSSYYIVINCVFTVHATNIFGRFRGIRAQLELVKYKFSNKITLHVQLWGLEITLRVKQCTKRQSTTYHDTTNCSGYHSTISTASVAPQISMYENFTKLLTHTSNIFALSI